MRDIILSLMAVLLVSATAFVALPAGAGVEKAGRDLRKQAAVDHARADELKAWTARLER